jgi:hypothetical protein
MKEPPILSEGRMWQEWKKREKEKKRSRESQRSARQEGSFQIKRPSDVSPSFTSRETHDFTCAITQPCQRYTNVN